MTPQDVSAPAPSGAAEAGAVLGDEWTNAVRGAIREWYKTPNPTEDAAEFIGTLLAHQVVALVAAAEERGAAAERERIVASLRRYEHVPFALEYADAIEGSAEIRALDWWSLG